MELLQSCAKPSICLVCPRESTWLTHFDHPYVCTQQIIPQIRFSKAGLGSIPHQHTEIRRLCTTNKLHASGNVNNDHCGGPWIQPSPTDWHVPCGKICFVFPVQWGVRLIGGIVKVEELVIRFPILQTNHIVESICFVGDANLELIKVPGVPNYGLWPSVGQPIQFHINICREKIWLIDSYQTEMGWDAREIYLG